jgi:hypothetical protein
MTLRETVILNPSVVTLNEVKSLRVNSVKDLSEISAPEARLEHRNGTLLWLY